MDAQVDITEERSFSIAITLYYIVLLGAFFIGMYGLLNLIWLAGNAVEQNARALSGL